MPYAPFYLMFNHKTCYNILMNKKCSFSGCEKKHCAKGLCNTHWAQKSRHGKLWPIVTNETIEERFNRLIKKDPNNGCWWWTAAGSGKFYKKTLDSGYGQLRYKGKSWMAHRWSYEQYYKVKLTSEDTLDHICRNTRCCNPIHLEKVTLSENVHRRNLYHALFSENRRFREFLKSKGHDPELILGGE